MNTATTNTAGETIINADDGRTIDGAITEVKAPDASLIVLKPAEYAAELFKPFNEELATEKRRRVRYDIQTKEGMTKAKEVLATLVKIRTRAEKAKSAAKKPIDQAGKEILSQYNTLEAAVKAEEKKHADAIEDEKKRIADIEAEKQRLERARIEAIEGRIEDIRLIPSTLAKSDAATLEAKLNELVARVLDPADYQEHLELAIGALNTTINDVRQLLTTARENEARDAELARLRAAEAQRKQEEEARQAAAAEAQRKQDEAAAAMAAQQQQMADILEVQGLANALAAAGKSGEREAVTAALAKARTFDPTKYGAMAPMATLARDAALPLLEDLLENLAPEIVTPDPVTPPASYVDPDIDQQPAAPAPAPVEQALAAAVRASGGGRLIPRSQKPHDLDILDVVAKHFDVPNATAIAWLAVFDADKARADLAEG